MRKKIELAGLSSGAGVIVAAVLVRLGSSLLFEISSLNPITHVLIVLGLLSAAALACWVVALRVARLDPSEALRAEGGLVDRRFIGRCR